MNAPTRVFTLAGVSALTLGSVTLADTGNDNARIAELERRLAQLEGNTSMTEQRADEVRALVSDVLADADTRSSMLQGGFTAGYNNGFRLQSADGNYSLKIGGQLQFRFLWNSQDEQAGVDTSRYGFENRRAKIDFSGNIVDKTWKYKVKGKFSRNSGDFELEDAEISKSFENGGAIRFGQFKAPYLREELVASSRQLTVERSLVNAFFTQGRSTGIEYNYATDQWRLAVMLSNGHNNINNGGALAYDTEFAMHARGEFLVRGTWDQFRDFTSRPGSDYGAMVGGAIRFEKAEYGTAATMEEETLGFTVDASAEGDGWSAYAAFIYESRDVADTDAMGIVVQGSYYLNDDWELFGRYEYGDDDEMNAFNEINVITVGANRYFAGHNAKFTADFGYALDAIDGDWSSTGAGWRTDTNSDSDGQFVLRTQFQLLF